jgi:hypothetical protein
MIEALGSALLLVTLPQQLASPGSLPAGYEHIEQGDWTPVALGTNSLVLTRPARPPNHVWVRWEDKRPDARGNLSSQSLEEFDCTGWRMRVVQVTAYRRNNFQDESASGSDVQPWSVPYPGTIDEAILEYVCGVPDR